MDSNFKLIGALTFGVSLLATVPASADDFWRGPRSTVTFSYDSGGYCDSRGCPDGFWNYPVSYCPVFFGGQWYRGPMYYRNSHGRNYFWVRGDWHRDEWRWRRPDWACVGRFGPALGYDFYRSHGFRWRNEWRDRWWQDHRDWDHRGRDWDRDRGGPSSDDRGPPPRDRGDWDHGGPPPDDRPHDHDRGGWDHGGPPPDDHGDRDHRDWNRDRGDAGPNDGNRWHDRHDDGGPPAGGARGPAAVPPTPAPAATVPTHPPAATAPPKPVVPTTPATPAAPVAPPAPAAGTPPPNDKGHHHHHDGDGQPPPPANP